MNNWIWWLLVLVIAVVVDLFIVTPLIRYIRHPNETRLFPAFEQIAAVIKKVADLYAYIKSYGYSTFERTQGWVRSVPRPMIFEKKSISEEGSTGQIPMATNQVDPLVSLPLDHADINQPSDNKIIIPEPIAPQVEPASQERTFQTIGGSKIKISVSLSPGQKVQIGVTSSSKNGHASVRHQE